MASRAILAKIVTGAILIYSMQTTLLSSQTCSTVEKIQRSFLWGQESNVRKIHTIPWKQIFQPKDIGKLGFKDLKVMNEACLFKLAQKLSEEPKDLWKVILQGKYGRNYDW